jgi:hypothetical protein
VTRSTISSALATLAAALAIVLATALAIVLAAPALGQPTPPTPPPPASDIDRVGDTLETMGEKPLKDFNLMRDKIPPELLAVMDRPYDLRGIGGCAGYKNAVNRLTAVLGPDVDSPKVTGQKQSASEVVLGGAETVVGGLIPGTGLIRKISGAEAAQKKAQAAVLAGSLRRAYIKGMARAKGCRI